MSVNTDQSRRPPTPHRARRGERAKRGLDVVMASCALAVAAPVLFGCAAWVWWLDGSPVVYRQWRVGRDGWLFRLYKLRTMRRDAESAGAQYATSADPRVLPGCRWMRRSHVDELPQLINVLLGHMSLVGPRPERPEIIESLRDDLPGIERRLEAAPGLTGLAQIRNGYANDEAGMRRKLACDLSYLRRRSLIGDLALILATVPRFWDRAAC